MGIQSIQYQNSIFSWKIYAEKYKSMSNSKYPFPDKLIPDPKQELCPCEYKYCSQRTAVDRYLKAHVMVTKTKTVFEKDKI
jgi:hypothetical protein